MKKIVYYTFLTLSLNACIGEDIVDDSQNMRERLSIVSGRTNSDTLFVGETLQLRAEFYDINGNIIPSTNIWTSSKTSVATVDQEGRVTALKGGATNIIVSSNRLDDQRLIVVPQLEKIEITSNSAPTVFIGDSIELIANYYNQRGELTTANITWSVHSRAAVELKSNGNMAKLIGKIANAVILKASANGIEKELSVTVIDDTSAVASISIQSSSTMIRVGETILFQPTVRNINGMILNNKPITWSSSDVSVLSVSTLGLATSLAPGAAIITATSDKAVSNGVSVLVSQAMTTSRSGVFSGNGSYTVNGNVTMEIVNNNLQLNFTNFSSSSGPGLYIYLGNSVNSGISIEALNNRTGSFTVDLPSSISIDDYNYVLIWCKPFGLTFGSALLN